MTRFQCPHCSSLDTKKYGIVGNNQKFNCNTCGNYFRIKKEEVLEREAKDKGEKSATETKELERVKELIKKPTSIIEIANELNKSPKAVEEIIKKLKDKKYNVHLTDNKYELSSNFIVGGETKVIDTTAFENKTYKIGFITDDHLCNKAERLDVINAVFDIYEEEGITDVYNAGNWIDGEARFNKLDLHTFGMYNQVKYFVDNYPQKPGMNIHFIAGDDHEGWYQQREGVIIGAYAEMIARKNGREDLHYLGYMERDIELKASEGSAVLRVVHPGGGTAYALSYQPQKLIESLTGGDKPQILLIGHYHKAEVLPAYRNVRAVQGGCGCDQTRFMRKKRIEAHIGAWIVEFQQSKDGAINRFKTEWLSFFDSDYYKIKKYYI